MCKIKSTTYQHNGHDILIEWFADPFMGPPWDEHDGHGPVSEWTTRDKRPGERPICSDRCSKRYYDFAEAVKIARRDGWDAPPYKTGTKGEQAVRAVAADYEYLKRWCDDDWHWCGYKLCVEAMDYRDACWGIESDSIGQFEAECVRSARAWIDKELAESNRAACADIATV